MDDLKAQADFVPLSGSTASGGALRRGNRQVGKKSTSEAKKSKIPLQKGGKSKGINKGKKKTGAKSEVSPPRTEEDGEQEEPKGAVLDHEPQGNEAESPKVVQTSTKTEKQRETKKKRGERRTKRLEEKRERENRITELQELQANKGASKAQKEELKKLQKIVEDEQTELRLRQERTESNKRKRDERQARREAAKANGEVGEPNRKKAKQAEESQNDTKKEEADWDDKKRFIVFLGKNLPPNQLHTLTYAIGNLPFNVNKFSLMRHFKAIEGTRALIKLF